MPNLTNPNDAQAYVEQCEKDPIFFIRNFLGLNLSVAQEALVNSIQSRKLTVGLFSRQCLASGTLITMGDGTLKSIEDIKPGDSVISLNENTLKYEIDKVKNMWKTDSKDVFNITINKNNKIRCSDKHQFLTLKGTWESINSGLEQVQPGSATSKKFWAAYSRGQPWKTGNRYVASIKLSKIFTSNLITREEARFLGYFIADGSYVQGQAMKFTNITKKYLDEVTELTMKLFPLTKIKSYNKGRGQDLIFLSKNTYKDSHHPHDASLFIRKHGLYHIRGPEKRIPRAVFMSSDAIKGEFINRLWAADGCVYINRTGKYPRADLFVGAETIEQGTDLIALLKTFGVRAHRKLSLGKKSKHLFWKIMVTNSDDILRFFDVVGPIFGKEQKSILAIKIANKQRDVWYNKRYRGDVVFDAINEIQKENVQEPMYDLEIKNNHNFIANDFVVHNSGKSTSVAAYVVWRLMYGKGTVINGTPINEEIIVASPSYPQSKLIYERIKKFIRANELVRSHIEGDMTLEKIQVKNGNICRMISASVSSEIRGMSPTLMIVDECQDVDDTVMNSVLLPMLTTTKGPLVKIGTPKQRGQFYASAYEDPTASVIVQPYNKCSFYSAQDIKEIEMKRSDKGGTMPIPLWLQEYNVEFTEMSSTALPAEIVKPCLIDYWYSTADTEQLHSVAKHGDYVIGIDLAREKDSTVITVIRRDKVPYQIVHSESHVHVAYTALMGRLKIISDHFQPSAINVDQTSEKGWSDLATMVGVPINPINFNLKEKEDMVNNLRVLFEKGILKLPKAHELLYSQIIHQQFETTIYGKKQFFHPTDEHDDELWALALGAMALNVDTTDFDDMGAFQDNVLSARSKLGYEMQSANLKERDASIIKNFREEQQRKRKHDEDVDSMVTGNTILSRGESNDGFA